MNCSRRSVLQNLPLGIVATLFFGCAESRTFAWNQKLIVTVETPDGVKSGSAVAGITVALVGSFASDPSGLAAKGTTKAEATVVDLGKGRYLFALLGEHSNSLAQAVFDDQFTGKKKILDTNQTYIENVDAWSQLEKMVGKEADVPTRLYPQLVTFDYVNKPKSAKEVNPDQMEMVFGAGYSLKSIKLEITDEKVTEGEVVKVLSWVHRFDNATIRSRDLEKSEYSVITERSFSQGFSK